MLKDRIRKHYNSTGGFIWPLVLDRNLFQQGSGVLLQGNGEVHPPGMYCRSADRNSFHASRHKTTSHKRLMLGKNTHTLKKNNHLTLSNFHVFVRLYSEYPKYIQYILSLGFINQFSDSFGVDYGEREFYLVSSVKEKKKSHFKTFECVL